MGRFNQRIFTLACVGLSLLGSPLMAKDEGGSTKWTGDMDVNYAYNFNKPSPAGQVANNPGASFASYNNNFTLNYVELGVVHSADPVTFTLALGYGAQADALGGDQDATTKNVQQAYMSYKFPTTGIILDVGKFTTHLGYEVNKSSDNWNYTRSLGYQFVAPTWHNGIKATYPAEKFSVGVSLTNGIDDAYDNNKTKDLGVQLSARPVDSFDVTLNYLKSIDSTVTPNNDLMYWDIMAHFTLNDQLGLGAHYGTREKEPRPSGTSKEVKSMAFYAKWDFHENWSLAPRVEMFDDPDGDAGVAAPGVAAVGKNDITSITLTLENRVSDNWKWRAEVRSDKSDKNIYNDEGNIGTEDGQNLVVLGLMAGF